MTLRTAPTSPVTGINWSRASATRHQAALGRPPEVLAARAGRESAAALADGERGGHAPRLRRRARIALGATAGLGAAAGAVHYGPAAVRLACRQIGMATGAAALSPAAAARLGPPAAMALGGPVTWAVFAALVTGAMAFDLGVMQRVASPSLRSTALASGLMVGLAVVFGAGLGFVYGTSAALQFATGYLIEKALSVDNLFVFLLIFRRNNVSQEQQKRLLTWGILGATVLRGAFVAAGTSLMHVFHATNYLFGAFLLFTGAKMLFGSDAPEQGENLMVRGLRRAVPTTSAPHGNQFFAREAGRLRVTPLFWVLAAVETSDLLFAVDSVPAVLAVTSDPFLVYTSNIFAILGLRSLYFLLADAMDRFHHLNYALAAVLAFIGLKMLLVGVVPIGTGVSLGVIGGLIGTAMATSWIWPSRAATASAVADVPGVRTAISLAEAAPA